MKPTSWCGASSRQVPSRLSHSRIASISPGSGFLFGDEVVQAEHHQRVRVGQHPFVNRQLVAGLIDALKHGDGMPGRLTDDLLE